MSRASWLRPSRDLRQKSDASLELFSRRCIDLFRVYLDQVPGGKGTLLYIEMGYHLIEPMHNTDFGTPLQVVRSLWKGLTILRMQKAYVKATTGLKMKDHSVSYEMHDIFELQVQQATNYLIILFLFPDLASA